MRQDLSYEEQDGAAEVALDKEHSFEQEPTNELPFGRRKDILTIVDTQYEVVDIPEWGCRVRVRSLTAGERDWWERLSVGQLSEEESKKHFRGVKLGPQHARAMVAHLCVLDGPEGSTRMFPDPNDIPQLARKHSAPLTRIFQAVVKASRITEEDIKELEEQMSTDPTNAPSTD